MWVRKRLVVAGSVGPRRWPSASGMPPWTKLSMVQSTNFGVEVGSEGRGDGVGDHRQRGLVVAEFGEQMGRGVDDLITQIRWSRRAGQGEDAELRDPVGM